MSRTGRPLLFRDSRQMSVLVSGDEYRRIVALVEQARAENKNFSIGDLLRSYIERGLAGEGKASKRRCAPNPKLTPARRLHAISRSVQELARELEKSGLR